MKTKAKPGLQAGGVVEALRERFPVPEWAFLEEVADATGMNARRRLDVVAVSLWPSRGLEAHGIEVKVTRPDWQRERADPEKAEAVARFCRCFYVAAPVGIVPVDELPPAWGLLEVDPTTRKVHTTRQPERRDVPEPTWAFLAALVRRAAEAEASATKRADARVAGFVAPAEMEVAIEERARVRAVEIAREEARKAAAAQAELGNLRLAVQAFESKFGVRLSDRYSWPKAGDSELFRALCSTPMDAQHALSRYLTEMAHAETQVRTIKSALEVALEELRVRETHTGISQNSEK